MSGEAEVFCVIIKTEEPLTRGNYGQESFSFSKLRAADQTMGCWGMNSILWLQNSAVEPGQWRSHVSSEGEGEWSSARWQVLWELLESQDVLNWKLDAPRNGARISTSTTWSLLGEGKRLASPFWLHPTCVHHHRDFSVLKQAILEDDHWNQPSGLKNAG